MTLTGFVRDCAPPAHHWSDLLELWLQCACDPARGPGTGGWEVDMNAKKGVLAVVVLFLGFYMFTDPRGLADLAEVSGSNGWDLTTEFFEATIRFLNELF